MWVRVLDGSDLSFLGALLGFLHATAIGPGLLLTFIGVLGVLGVLRAAVGLVEDAAERASQETHGRDEDVRDGDASVTSAAAARLAALCRDAGEGRTLRRVETATARVERLSRAPVA